MEVGAHGVALGAAHGRVEDDAQLDCLYRIAERGELVKPRRGDDEAAGNPPVRALVQPGMMAQGGTHRQLGRREERGVVDEAFEERTLGAVGRDGSCHDAHSYSGKRQDPPVREGPVFIWSWR